MTDKHPAPAKTLRLSKLMVQTGLCSRREADKYIERGWVYVDNLPINTLGTKVYPHQKIVLDTRALAEQNQTVTILLNKPLGVVSAQPEKGYAPAITLIKPETRFPQDTSPLQFKPGHLKGLAPAGRLDINSQGLLVLTQDGRIARQLVGSPAKLDKEYLVRFKGRLTDQVIKLLNFGLVLDSRPLKPARVKLLNPDQLQFILKEGRKRQIRRMCQQVKLEVTAIKRVRIGAVTLGKLPIGQWRYLGEQEVF